MVRIAGQTNPAKKIHWQVAIDNFLKDPLTAEDERNVKELLSWYRNDVEVKKSIEELKSAAYEGIKRLETQQKNAAQEVQKGLARLETSLKDHLQEGLEGATLATTQDIKDMKDMLRQVLNVLAEDRQPSEGKGNVISFLAPEASFAVSIFISCKWNGSYCFHIRK